MSAGAPKDWLFFAINEAFFHKAGEGTNHPGFIGGIECKVGVLPIAQHTEAAELTALDVDELAGVFLRATADFGGLQASGGLHHAEFDRKTMAIPARNKWGAEACHRAGFDHEILENFIESGAHVHVAVRERRAVVQQIQGRVFPVFLNFLVESGRLPIGEHFGFALRQTGLHRKIGFWEIDGVFVSAHEKPKPLTAQLPRVNDPSSLYRNRMKKGDQSRW